MRYGDRGFGARRESQLANVTIVLRVSVEFRTTAPGPPL